MRRERCYGAEHDQCHEKQDSGEDRDLDGLLRNWETRLSDEGEYDIVRCLLLKCRAFDLVDGQLLIEFSGQPFDPALACRLGRWIVSWSVDQEHESTISGLWIQTGANETNSCGRGFSLNLDQDIKTYHLTDQPRSNITETRTPGGAENMETNLNVEVNALASPFKLPPELIVETAAVILRTKQWSLRGLSTSLEPDFENRAILAYCFMDLSLGDVGLFGEFMNYSSALDVLKDAQRGEELMAVDRYAALRGTQLNAELSRLDLRGFTVPGDHEDGQDDIPYGENVIRFPVAQQVANFEEFVEAIK